jgi:hypothetical protein
MTEEKIRKKERNQKHEEKYPRVLYSRAIANSDEVDLRNSRSRPWLLA